MLKILNILRTEFDLQHLKTSTEKQHQALIQNTTLPKDKDYILKNIKSCKNKLHIDFTRQMVNLFDKKYSKIDKMSTLELEEAITERCQFLTI